MTDDLHPNDPTVPDARLPPHALRWWQRRLVRWPVRLLLAVVLLAVLLIGLLQVSSIRGWLVDEGLAAANELIAGELRVEAVEGNLLTSVGLRGVTIVHPDGSESLRLDHLAVDLDLPALLSRTAPVTAVALRGLETTVYDDAGGISLLEAVRLLDPGPDEEEPEEPGAPWEVAIGSVALEDVTVHERPEGGRRITLALAAGLRIGPDQERLHLQHLRVTEGAANTVELAGVIEDFTAPRLHVSLPRFAVDLATLGIAGVQGVVEGTAAVSGGLDRALLRVDANSTGGHLSLIGSAGLAEAGPVWSLVLQATALRPTALVPALEPDMGLDLRVVTRGAGDPTTDGTAELSVVLTGLEGIDGPPLPLRVDAEVDRGALVADLTGRDASGGGIEVHAQSPSLAAQTLDVSASIKGAHIARWASFLDEPDLGGVIDELSVVARVDQLGAGGIDATWTLRGRRLSVPEPLGGPAAVGILETTGAVTYTGAGLPVGRIQLMAESVDAGMAMAGLRTVSLDLAATAVASDAVRAHGRVTAGGLTHTDKTSLAGVKLPFDLVLGPEGQPRSGTVSVEAGELEHEAHRVGRTQADLQLETVAGSLGMRGPLSVERVRIGGGTTLDRATIGLDVTRSFLGDIDATLGLDVGTLGGTTGISIAGTSGELKIAVPHDDPARVSARGDLTVGRVQTAQASVSRVQVTLDAGLEEGAPVGEARLVGQRIKVGRTRVASATVAARLGADGVNTLRVDTGKGDVDVNVDLVVDGILDGSHALATRIRTGRVERKGLGFQIEPGGKVTFDPTTGVVDVRDARLALIGPRASEIDASARFNPRTEQLKARLKTEALPLATWVDTARRLGFALAGLGPVGGRLSLDVDVDGSLRRPEAKVSARLVDGRFGELKRVKLVMEGAVSKAATALGLDLGWSGGRLVRLSLALPERVAKRWRPDADTALSLAATVENVDLRQLRRWLPKVGGKELRGRVDADIDFTGTIGLPSGTANLQLAGLGTGGPSDADGKLALEMGGDGVSGSVSVSTRGKERLSVVAALPRTLFEAALIGGAGGLGEQAVHLDVELAPTRVGDLPFTAGVGDVRRMKASADLRVVGTVSAPVIGGSIAVSSIPVQTTTAQAGVDVATRDGILRGALSVTSRGRELLDGILAVPLESAMRGPGDLLEDKQLRVGLSSHLPVSVLSELDPGLGRFLADAVDESNIDFTAQIAGGLPGERRLGAQLVLQSPRPEQELLDLGLAGALRLSAEMREETTRVHFVAEQGPHGGHLFLNAELDDGLAGLLRGELGPATNLVGALASRGFLLEGLPKAMPSVFGPTHGELAASATLGGTLGDPRFDGRLAFEFDEVHLIPLGLIQRDLVLGVAFDRKSVRMDPPLHIDKRAGTFDFDFTVGTEVLDPARMELKGGLELVSFELLRRRDAQMTLSGGIALDGTLAKPEIHGELRVDEGNLAPEFGGRDVQNIGLPDDVVFVSSEETIEEALVGEEGEEVVLGTSAAGATLDVTVDIPPRSIRVKNDMADIQLEGDISVRTQDSLVSVKGLITVLFGTVEIVGLEWVVDPDSKVILTGSPIIDPVLSIRAETDISEVDLSPIDKSASRDSRIYVEVTGTATRPELKLSSNEGLSQTHILSILAIGKPIGDIGAAGDGGGEETGEPTPMENQVLTTVVGVAMGSISTLVTENLPVDVFELTAGGEETGFEEAQVRVGKRITRDWLVLYSYDGGANADRNDGPKLNEHELTSEYAITPWLLWEVKAGDQGQGATELMFRWRF